MASVANEAADEAAREATRHPAVALTVLPSIQGAQGTGQNALPSVPQSKVSPAGGRDRGRQPGTKKARTTTSRYAPTQQLSRAEEVVLHDFGLAT
ncbi:hypothetical protein GWK47_012760 [Chionoecetes opilio]|uniref:Uncharacterized protein n=1 Tax=Chionoecetes opilio TaxID=41210 RepID=A0A8J5CLR8_CHIOP|nr:hypothetical protein GWK47_012760 [Chionoecetes opilio]